LDHRQPLDSTATATMLALCLIWSVQQVALKAVANEIAPMMQIALRSGVAALLVAGLMRWRGEAFVWTAWRAGALVGLLFALEFVFVGEALRHTSAAHTVVFLYTAPIFAALGLHWKLPAERLARIQWLGIALAFAGVATAFLGPQAAAVADTRSAGADALLGDLLALLGAASWGATTVVIRSTALSQTQPTQTLLYQLLCAFALLMALSGLFGQFAFQFSPRVWASLAFQSVVVSFISFLTWFWLLRKYLASRLGVFSFLTPVFGVLLGVWLLDEPIEPRFVLGAAMVLGGILVVSAHGLLRQGWRRLMRFA
jgi:drug/metabolite transporter (DMT)-like permease